MLGFREEQGRTSSTTVTRTSNQDSDKCYCSISRAVQASVTTDPADPTFFSTFISICIVASCEKDWEYSEEPRVITGNGFSLFQSFHSIPCKDQPCPCDVDLGDGVSMSRTSACVASLQKVYTSENTGDSMPKWAQEILAGAPAQQVAQTINTEEQEPGDPMGFGPYDANGNPSCSTIKKKGCCKEARSQFGIK
jgi:hypothetical protein